MYIGIKEGKVFDLVSDLKNRRRADKGILLSEDELNEIIYVESKGGDPFPGDTWDFENNCSLKDSPQRFIEPEPTELELLKEKYDKLEKRLKKLESK